MAPLQPMKGLVSLIEVETAQPVLALTFDDGPDPERTPRVLDMLAEAGARATFFVIGQKVLRHADLARRIVAEGHEIGNHSFSHPYLVTQGDDAVLREVDLAQRAVFDVVGHQPVIFRAPHGRFTPHQKAMLHANRALPTIGWNVDPKDWRYPGETLIAERMIAGAAPGAILLAHDVNDQMLGALPETLAGILAQGLEFRTISALLGWPRWQDRQPLSLPEPALAASA